MSTIPSKIGRKTSRVFGANTTDRIDYGNPTHLNNLPQGANGFTVLSWVYCTGSGANQHIITKDQSTAAGRWFLIADNAFGDGELRMIVNRTSGVRTDYRTSPGVVPFNRWTCVAGAFSDALTPKLAIYRGDVHSPMTQAAYALAQDGSGAIDSDSASSIYVGNLQRAPTNPFKGNIAVVRLYNRALTRAEIEVERRLFAAQSKHSSCIFDLDTDSTCRDKRRNVVGALTGTAKSGSVPASRQWITVGSGASDLFGAAAISATGAGELKSDIAMSAASLATATATGVITQSLGLFGSAASIAIANGTATITTNFSGDAFTQVFASGLLRQTLELGGSASGDVSASGNLDAGSGLGGAAAISAIGSGQLGMQIAISGSSIVEALATANLDAGLPSGLSGAAAANASASGSMSVDIPITGVAPVVVTGSGGVTSTQGLSGAAASLVSVTGDVVVSFEGLSASAIIGALAGGSLQMSVSMSADALVSAIGIGSLYDAAIGYVPTDRVLVLEPVDNIFGLSYENLIFEF